MDAPPLPVLSRWAPVASAPEPSTPALPDGMARVAGIAGSPQAALMQAQQQFPGRDVLLLRADAELPADAWRRLAAAWTDGSQATDWQVLSPIDGQWPVFAAGVGSAERDALAWARGEHASFLVRDWSPVCSLWRAGVVADSASPEVLRCGLLPCLYVGPAMDPRDGELPLPLKALRHRVAASADACPATPGQPVLLHVLHGWGGGIERFVRDLAAGDPDRQHLALVARTDDDRAPFGRRLCLHANLDAPPLRVWTLSRPIELTDAASPEVQSLLAELVAEWGIGAVLVSSLVGHALDVLRTGLPTAVCVHDTYPAWPLLHDVRDPANAAFDLAALEQGLLQAGPGYVLAGRTAADWWTLRDRLIVDLARADALMVAPSASAQRRLCAIAPALAARRWQTIPHGLAPMATAATPAADATPPVPGPRLRVLVPGRFHGAKGETLLAAMIDALPAGVDLVLLGCGHRGARFEGRAGITVHRDYVRDDLPAWIARLAPDLGLLPSTVPETFSYTLSELRALGVPVLCASPGAPTERILSDGIGWVVAADGAAVNERLAWFAAHRDEIAAMRSHPLPVEPSLEAMAETWRTALPTVATPLRFVAASAERRDRIAQQLDGADLAVRLLSSENERAEATLELARRADWAHDLQRQLSEQRQRVEAQPPPNSPPATSNANSSAWRNTSANSTSSWPKRTAITSATATTWPGSATSR